MWERLRHILWQWRGVLVTVPSVTAAVVGLRYTGLLQPVEFPVLDQFFLLRPAESRDNRIVIVEINESDVQRAGQWPMSDATLARLLGNLKRHKPVAIGLDLYRDLPVEPGHQTLNQLFATTPNLIGVQKIKASADSSAVAPPPVLKQNDQVGANDLVLDADGKVRRGLFYLEDQENGNIFSFALLLADRYLQAHGIQIDQTPDGQIKAGPAVFSLFQPDDGGYVHASTGGYQVLLNYRGMIQQFDTVSMTDVLANHVPTDQIRDRVVLIGATSESLKDLFYVPYSSTLTTPTRMAGVTIHANLVSQIISAALDGRPPVLQTWKEPLEWLWILLWAGVGGIITWMPRYDGLGRRLAAIIGIVLAAGCLVGISFLVFLQGWWIPLVPSLMALLGSAVAITAYVARSAADLRRTFGRYLTDEVVASLLETPGGQRLGGERRKVTIMFTDLRGFSAISEWLPPEKVVTVLNLYLAVMSDTVAQFQGTINEIIGDGILVLFGAPIQREDDSQRAIACALAMQKAMEQVNQQNQQQNLPTIEMGIGINTGEVVVGNIGSQKRAKYTATGNHVNLASRIESYTVGRQILISEYTYHDAGPVVKVSDQFQVEPKGIKKPLTLYEVSGIDAKFNIFLSEQTQIFCSLPTPIPLRYTVLEGKHLVGTLFQGELMRLSEKEAEFQPDHFLPQLSNLKINLLDPANPDTQALDFYAKVLNKPAETPDCVRIRFTGLSPQAQAILNGLRQSATNHATESRDS